jgi:ribosome biogenesis GTPase A
MSIQWFPGHMAKARRQIAESITVHDIVIEVLDARLPHASENPLITELRKHRPCVKVLTKSDLADAEVTEDWIRYFGQHRTETSKEHPAGHVAALAITTERRQEARRKIPELCRRLLPHRTAKSRTLRAIVLGIPNVGKSTLFNMLAGRKAANVGDKPGVTKAQQLVELDDGIVLSDTPGMLWPRIDDDRAGLCLAFAGSIPDTAVELEQVAMFGAQLILDRYAKLAVKRYNLKETPATADALLDEIGRRRGGLRPGGAIDRHKASEILIHDFRSGALGRISLETPPAAMFP